MEFWDSIGDWLGKAGDFIYNNPEQILAGAGTVMGGVGAIQNMIQSNQQNKLTKQAAQMAGQPIDPSQFYQPMTDAMKQQFLNTLKADLVTRGVPLDSSYASGYLAEKMAAYENQLQQQAIQNAMSQRGLQLQGMQTAGAMQAQQAKPSGDFITPLLSYFQAQRRRKDANQPSPGTTFGSPTDGAYPGGYPPEYANAFADMNTGYPAGEGGQVPGGYEYTPENTFSGEYTEGAIPGMREY